MTVRQTDPSAIVFHLCRTPCDSWRGPTVPAAVCVPKCGLCPPVLLMSLSVGGRGVCGGVFLSTPSFLARGRGVGTWQCPGPTKSHYGAIWGLSRHFLVMDGELRSPNLSPRCLGIVAFVDICDSPFSPGESFSRVRCHRAPRVITGTRD